MLVSEERSGDRLSLIHSILELYEISLSRVLIITGTASASKPGPQIWNEYLKNVFLDSLTSKRGYQSFVQLACLLKQVAMVG